VKGVLGTWKDLTDNVNILAGNLTDQVRNIARSPPRCQRRPSQKTRRRARRGAGPQEHHQTPCRSDAQLRLGSHFAWPSRADTRRKAGRPGRGARGRRRVEGPDRQRERAGREPDRQVATSPRSPPRWRTGTCRRRSRSRRAARVLALKDTHHTMGGPAAQLSPRR